MTVLDRGGKPIPLEQRGDRVVILDDDCDRCPDCQRLPSRCRCDETEDRW